jgi:LmbE family N-acetylglucosaminyl deacetylase
VTRTGPGVPAVTGPLLGVWAHPDDEAYLSAGLMAVARAAGRRVVVVTATRGEHGTDDAVTWPPARLAVLRERELDSSLQEVDVSEHHWLGYADGSLGAVPGVDGVRAVEAFLRRLRPATVVTFGPDGMTGHEDHRVVSSWVTEAWHRVGREPALWHATLTPEFHARWGRLNAEVGLWFGGATPPVTPRDELAEHLVCSGALLEVKNRALRAHASQTAELERLVGSEVYRAWWSTESFVAAPGSGPRTLSPGPLRAPGDETTSGAA